MGARGLGGLAGPAHGQSRDTERHMNRAKALPGGLFGGAGRAAQAANRAVPVGAARSDKSINYAGWYGGHFRRILSRHA